MDASPLVPSWCRDPRTRHLAAVGMVLIGSGLLHALVWALAGGPWEGPVTWRKPILFGVSGGLTALSLGWAWSKLPWRRGDAWLAAATAWALAVEVGLIDLQRWRGVASHFNRGTPLDSFLYDLMGGLILGVTLVVVDLTIRFLLRPVGLTADMLLAARAGLVLLAVSCLLGIWISVHGDLRVASGLPPETVGAAGVAKFPHGVAIHAVQWLPLVAWAARLGGLGDALRLRLVAAAAAGTTLVLGYSIVQTLAGRGRFDATGERLHDGVAEDER
ncbi:MAG: hypothetical protein EBZ59_07445, partial [Planctomycetia bacterium]|nr:hypothetical protein [Planctomycetia bacterium]